MKKNDIINDVVFEMLEDIGRDNADKLKAVLLTRLHNIDLVETETLPSVDVYDNTKILERFAIDMIAKGLKKSTIEQYLWIVKKFLNTTGLSYRYVTGQDITDYLAIRQVKEHISQSYKSTTLRYLSAFFTWAYRKRHIEVDIMLDVDSIKAPQKPKRRLTDEEVEMCRSLASRDTEKSAILETMLSTGMRIGEMRALKVSDLNFRDGTIRIWGEKSSVERTGIMTPRFKIAVMNHLKGRTSGFLFESRSGKCHSKAFFEKISKDLGEKAEKENCTVHLYRKTFASIMYRKTKDILLVSKLLGHASTETTVRYYLVDDIADIQHRVLSVA